jgi:hypothetical protein
VPASPEKLHRYIGPAWFNLGASQLLQRHYDAAAESYGRARAAFGAAAEALKVAECDLQLAWASLMGGRVSPAAGYLQSAGAALHLEPDADLHFSYLCHMALLALKTGRLDDAEEHCHQVLAPAQLGVTAHHRGEAAWVLGEVALGRTSLDQAKVHASRAMDEAIRCKWPGLMNLASELHQRIAQAKDRTA